MKLGATTSLCEACPPSPWKRWTPNWTPEQPVSVGYRGRMLCPPCTLDAIHADGLTLDEAMGYTDE